TAFLSAPRFFLPPRLLQEVLMISRQQTFLKYSRRFFLLSILSIFFLLQNLPSTEAVDLFEAFSLPERPLALNDPAWASAGSHLTISHTREEMYKRWQDGVETDRFDGMHSKIDLRAQLLNHFAVNAYQLFDGDQTWSNYDAAKTNSFSFKDQESESGIALIFSKPNFAASVETWKGLDAFTGKFRIHPDIVAALGTNPGIAFDNPYVGRRQRLFFKHNRMKSRFEWFQGSSSHTVRTLGARMELVVPFERSYSGYAGEWSFDIERPFEPYLRLEKRSESGNGVSLRDGRFIFGHTEGDWTLSTTALGFAFPKRHRPWFFEIDRNSMTGQLYFQNNLIVLDPLFLFTTNEMRSRQTVPSIKPWGARLGGDIPTWRGLHTQIQYGLSDVDFTTDIEDESVQAFRIGTKNTFRERRDRFRLHRLAISIKRPDRSGHWGLNLRLMVPQALAKPTTETTTGGGGGGGGTGVKAASPKTSVRGGWQLTIERELTLF
ncbi:MAG: hypothetical protein WA705_18230, partial [Candidatus Ozemobacteraceae bacterium]